MKPKHTFESAVKKLVLGLEDGSIVLRPAPPGQPDWWEIEGIKCVISLEQRPDY